MDENQKIVKVRYALRKLLDTELPFYYRPFTRQMEDCFAHYIDMQDFDIQYIL